MSITAGTRLGPYEIVSFIGAGGMGEVYRARDPRLNRDVAIKVLPGQFTGDADRLRRFEQEARAAGMLNHPNIVTIYDVGSLDGMVYVVAELLEGETLRRRLNGGALSLRKAVDYALQISHGLAAAHDKGIFHRDLKPENIYITRDGRAKILDFGLAKLADPIPQSPAEHSKLQTIDPRTQPGVVLGTVGYMSPEQVRAMGSDHRSDIFTFGAILYEMITGTKAFHGNSAADAMSAILKEDPPELSGVTQKIPPSFERVIRHCLEKNPEDRFQSARDLAFDLEMISGISASTGHEKTVGATPVRRIPSTLLYALLVLAGLCSGLLIGKRFWTHDSQQQIQSAIIPEFHFQRLTDVAGEEYFPSISPDGKSFVYVKNAGDHMHIFLSRVGGQKPIDLTENSPVDNTQPAFSPDGQQIAYRSERDGGGLFVLGATGESVNRVSDFGFNPGWSPDQNEIVCATEGVDLPYDRGTLSQLWSIRVPTGEKRLISKGDAVQPSWSPHGYRIAYWGLQANTGQRDIWTVSSSGANVVPVTGDQATDANPFWSSDGQYLYFMSDRGGTVNLWRVRIDESSGKVLRKPEAITTPSSYSAHFGIAATGDIVFSALNRRSMIEKFSFDPDKEKIAGQAQTILSSSGTLIEPSASPDNQWLSLYSQPQQDIYLVRTDGSEIRKLTDDSAKDRHPQWSSDGKSVIFMSDRSGRYHFWMIHTDGSQLQKVTEYEGRSQWGPNFSPDGSHFSAVNEKGTYVFDTAKPIPWKNPEHLPPIPGHSDLSFRGVSWSWDSKTLAGYAQRADNMSAPLLLLYSFKNDKFDEIALPYIGPEFIFWLKDNRRVIFASGGKLMIADTLAKTLHQVESSAGFTFQDFCITSDSRTIFLLHQAAESDIWLMSPETSAKTKRLP
jgi:serine/threonine protein kinase